MQRLALISMLLVVSCDTTPSTPTGSSPDPVWTSDGADTVTLKVATPERLSGTYVDASGTTLVFETARTADVLYLHLATGAGRELLHAETFGDTYVFRYLGGRLTLTIDKAWVAAVKAEGEDGPAAKDESALHWTGEMAVLDEMLAIPEMAALPWMSRALGEKGLTGSAYPASLAMHKMARQASEALGTVLPPIAVDTNDGSYCTRPTANECYGMCGQGCSCWSWVCGDCCYHSGCAKHDSWCRQGQWYYCYNITAVIALFGC